MTNEYAIKVLAELRGYGDKFANIGFDRKEALDLAIKALEQQVCDNDCEHCDWVTCPKLEEENETITVSKGCLKARKGRFVVYDVEYLKSHIEQEAAIYGNVSAIEALKKSEWIPCSERLPEDGDTFLVTIEYNGEVIGVDAASYSPFYGYIDKHWDTFEDWKEDDDTCYHVTAWMPLPKPYKKEADA